MVHHQQVTSNKCRPLQVVNICVTRPIIWQLFSIFVSKNQLNAMLSPKAIFLGQKASNSFPAGMGGNILPISLPQHLSQILIFRKTQSQSEYDIVDSTPCFFGFGCNTIYAILFGVRFCEFDSTTVAVSECVLISNLPQ